MSADDFRDQMKNQLPTLVTNLCQADERYPIIKDFIEGPGGNASLNISSFNESVCEFVSIKITRPFRYIH